MKKKYNILVALLVAIGFSSCDMEKYPYNAVEEGKYMTTLSDFASARIGLYDGYRTITTGGYILTPEFQCDDFLASSNYSNTYGQQYRWDFQPTEPGIENFWKSYYKMIARSNYYLDSYTKIKEGATSGITEAEMSKIEAYVGEAYFTRAYSYFQLATLFCNAYNPSTAETDWGLPLQLVYHPTSNAAKYPGRSSLKATFEQILSDLKNAETHVDPSKIVDPSNQSLFNYISQDVVTALKSRIALHMKDFATAINASTSLINGNKYALINKPAVYRDMWVHDMGTEVIWQIFMNKDAYGSPTGVSFWGQHQNDISKQSMDFIPSQSLLDLYTEGDIRFNAYFTQFEFKATTGASGLIYVFDKYPGNPDLQPEISVNDWYTNKSKPFRISEQYLIAAEAYCENNDTQNGGKYLNLLRKERITGYVDESFNSVNTLMEAIRNERRKELTCEGFRFVDLKRWGIGVDRDNAYQNSDFVLQPGNVQTTALSKAANDFRFVWPIPKTETDVNPQIKAQQNPGY